MKRIKYSNFSSMNEILNGLNFDYNQSAEMQKQKLFNFWEEIVGAKFSSVSKPYELTKNNVLMVSCANSFIANELFMLKKKIFLKLSEKATEVDLEIKDLRFDYKNWIEQNK